MNLATKYLSAKAIRDKSANLTKFTARQDRALLALLSKQPILNGANHQNGFSPIEIASLKSRLLRNIRDLTVESDTFRNVAT